MGMAISSCNHGKRISDEWIAKGMMCCNGCGAIFHKDAKFMRVSYPCCDTTGRYNYHGKCDDTKCPFCGLERGAPAKYQRYSTI